jgi:hypothetical protein
MKMPAASTTDTVANNRTFSRFVSSMTAKEETKHMYKQKGPLITQLSVK